MTPQGRRSEPPDEVAQGSPSDDDGESPKRPWAAVAVALAGSFMVMLDTTIVNVALPQMADELGAEEGIEWVVTAYLLALGVAQAPTGWVAERVGTKQAFLGAIACFSVASGLVATAPTLELVIAGRVAQGLAGGVALPLATALIFDLFPPGQRGTAVGTAGAALMIAPAIGPVLSGSVVDTASWRWLMLIHLPIGLGAAIAGIRLIPSTAEQQRRPLDLRGLGMVSVGLVALLVASTEASRWGVGSPRFLLVFGGGLVLLAAFVRRSLRVADPVLHLSVFRHRTFALCMGLVVVLSMPQFARNVFVPVELQTVRGMSAFGAGLVLAAAAVLGAVAMPVGGRWTDRSGGRRPIATGLVLLAASTGLLAWADLSTPSWQVAAFVACSGLGTVFVSMPTTVVALGAVEDELMAHGAVVRSLVRQVAAAMSTAVLAAIIVASAGVLAPESADAAVLARTEDAYDRGYLVAATVALAGLVLVALLPSGAAGTSPSEATSSTLETGPS